jgi:uncharacterized coiled-coil protein SlyX
LSFSQTSLKDITTKPKIITDSSGLTLIAFNEEQITYIIKEFKTSSINKKLIKELENQIILWKKSNRLLTNERDTLKKQIKTYIEIKINLEGQIYIQEQKIDELSKNLEDYKTIENNLNIEIKTYKGKIKRKNGWITKLIITNIITTSLLIFILI